jgi:hypothetical protein
MTFNLHLWDSDDLRATGQTSLVLESTCVCQTWGDPSQFADVIGIDFGLGKMHAYSARSGGCVTLPAESAIGWVCSRQKNTLVVCEWAHFAVPQTIRSLAQLFTAEQLISLYSQLSDKEITLRLFPHQHSGQLAREWAAVHFPEVVSGKKSDDMNDAKALAMYVLHCNQVSLAKPPASFATCSKQEYGRAVIKQANIVLNAERCRGYKGSMFKNVVSLGRTIRKLAGRQFVDHKVSISIAALICGEIDGKPVLFTRNGSPPGAWFWLRHVMKFSPFHHRAGIARSNLMRHRFRSYLPKHAAARGVLVKAGSRPVQFGHFDAKQAAAKRAALKSVRESVVRAYRIGVEKAIEMGFEPYEIVERDKAQR